MNNSIISIKNLNKSYKDKNILNDLNWEIQSRDIIALLGKNGAGKSTLLESIMNLCELQSGELQIWGNNWKDLPKDNRDKIGFVAQDIAGFEWIRVNEFLNYLGSFFASWDKTYCEDLISRWGIDPKKKWVSYQEANPKFCM
jgi:ABC-2 type transport system ATP-binding protein